MLNNTLKEKMAKRPVFGMTIYSNFPPVIENLAYYGFDFAFIDAEHCPWEVTSLREAVLAARFAGISPLVRVTKPDMIEIRKAFEMGAEGVIVPHVKTAEDVKLCVKAGKFPPKGRRGFDMTVRSAHYGVGVNSADYIQHTFDTEMIIPMAEDFEFMDNINEILAVEGVDAINFGPADYSMSTNRPSGYDMKNSDTDEVLRSIVAAARPKGIGVMAPALPTKEETIPPLISKGVNLLVCGSDIYHWQRSIENVLKSGVEEYLK